jgi:hypothetical protein
VPAAIEVKEGRAKTVPGWSESASLEPLQLQIDPL